MKYTAIQRMYNSIAILLLIISSTNLSAQDTNYVADLPTPAQLKASVKGINEADTYAKQAEVMDNVYQMIQYCIVGRRRELPAESKYLVAMNKFNEELYNNYCRASGLSPADRNSRAYFVKARSAYAYRAFEKYMVDELFGPRAQAQYAYNNNSVKEIDKSNEDYAAANKKAEEKQAASDAKEKRTNTLYYILGVLGILLAVFIFGARLKQMIFGSSGSGRIT